MAERNERVTLKLDDNFTSGLARMAEAVEQIRVCDQLRRATWEPHDWSDLT